MRKTSVLALFLLTMAACDGNGPECGGRPCEIRARVKAPPRSGGTNASREINLSRQEQSSLSAALASANAGAHIHADAKNGQFAFSADTAASHVTGNEPEISLKDGGPAMKVVATPAANDLLQRRTVR
jgi:hypothetical protein